MSVADQLKSLVVSMSELNVDPRNTRIHSRKNIDAVKVSFERFGQRQPIVVQSEGMVIRAGNCRFKAAEELGWTEIAALVVEETDADAIAYAIADNRTGELAEWDYKALVDLATDFKLDLLGFEMKDLEAMDDLSTFEGVEPVDVFKRTDEKDAASKSEPDVVIKLVFPPGHEEIAAEVVEFAKSKGATVA